MRNFAYSSIVLAPLAALLLAAPALAQGGDTPPGAVGSGVITAEQLANEVATYKIEKFGVHVHFALPENWKVEEQGKDAKTKKLRENLPIYIITSMAPTSNPNDPTDLIFEVDIFDNGLTSDLPANTPDDKRREERAKRFWAFLNTQMTLNIKSGNTTITKRAEIEAKPYGYDVDEESGKRLIRSGRPVQYFVPIFYEVPPPKNVPNAKGAYLYTFSTFTGDTPWMVKFLVSKEQKDQYGMLIAFVMDNAFGLTDKDYKAAVKAREAAAAKAKNAK